MAEISAEDFKKLELRVAKVLEVSEIPGADRLWKLRIEVGLETKEIVAGVKKFYTREQLIHKSIVVVNNLAPAMIKGVESRGMLLAAKSENALSLIVLDAELPSGSVVG